MPCGLRMHRWTLRSVPGGVSMRGGGRLLLRALRERMGTVREPAATRLPVRTNTHAVLTVCVSSLLWEASRAKRGMNAPADGV